MSSRRPERFGCHQLLIRLRQQAREQRSPGALPLVASDQVLADLDRHMMQAAPFAMHRDGVIRRIVDVVGFVVADDEVALLVSAAPEEMGETRIAIVEHASMPGPRHAHEDRREAVHRDQRRRPAGLASAVEFGFDAIMVGPENLAHARAPCRLRSSRCFPVPG